MILQTDTLASGGNGPAAGVAPPGQDETFWNKLGGTLGRKKKGEEVKEVTAEGKHAIDSPGMPKSAELPPEVGCDLSLTTNLQYIYCILLIGYPVFFIVLM